MQNFMYTNFFFYYFRHSLFKIFNIKLSILHYILFNIKCVGQFCPGFQLCKGKGLAQYPVWRETNIWGHPAEEWIKLPSEERWSMFARNWAVSEDDGHLGTFVRGAWLTCWSLRTAPMTNLITEQRGKYPTKSNGRKWQISSGAVTSALNVSQLTFWPH